MYKKIAQILTQTGKSRLFKYASERIDNDQNKTLHLRNLDLDVPTIISVLLEKENTDINSQIKSLSVSYNQLLGDEGAIAIEKHLPYYIAKTGLVDCKIGDVGVKAILA